MKWAPSVRWSRRTAEMGLPCHCNGHLLLAFLKELLLLIVTLMVTPGPKALPHLSDVVSQCFRLTLIFSLFFSIYCFSSLSLPPSLLSTPITFLICLVHSREHAEKLKAILREGCMWGVIGRNVMGADEEVMCFLLTSPHHHIIILTWIDRQQGILT